MCATPRVLPHTNTHTVLLLGGNTTDVMFEVFCFCFILFVFCLSLELYSAEILEDSMSILMLVSGIVLYRHVSLRLLLVRKSRIYFI